MLLTQDLDHKPYTPPESRPDFVIVCTRNFYFSRLVSNGLYNISLRTDGHWCSVSRAASWSKCFEKLQTRYPDVASEQIARVLRRIVQPSVVNVLADQKFPSIPWGQSNV